MSNSVATPSFYADFEGLTSLKKDVKANDPQAIREAARQFESLFTEMMLKSMRAAKLGEGLGDSDQTDFYQEMYDQQLAVQMSQGKGLGLADMLIQQLTRSGVIPGAASAAPAHSVASHSGAVSASSAAAAPRATGSGDTVGPAAISPPGSAPSRGHGASQRQRISFVQSVAPYAQQAASQLGVSADALIAQAALETGWGQHVPAGGGSSSNNLFGIKAGTASNAPALSAATTEYQRGVPMRLKQSFRAYSSVQQGLNDYVTVLRRQPGFQAALGTGEDLPAFANALQRGGYATDPDYASKLLATARTVKQLRAAHTGDALVAQSTAQNGSAAASAALKPSEAVPITASGDSV